MCHTLLQYYIHCHHSATHFYPCPIIRERTQSNRSHLNYSQIPEYISALYQWNGYDQPKNRIEESVLPSEWRDHSVPLSVAHSYHRVCPSCAEEKTARDLESEREGRRRRGVEMWREYSGNIHHGDEEDQEEQEDQERIEREWTNAVMNRSGIPGPTVRALTVRAGGPTPSDNRHSDRSLGPAIALRISSDIGIPTSPGERIQDLEARISRELVTRGIVAASPDLRSLGTRFVATFPVTGLGLAYVTNDSQTQRHSQQQGQPAESQVTLSNLNERSRSGGPGSRVITRQELARAQSHAQAQTQAEGVSAESEEVRVRRRRAYEGAIVEDRQRIEESMATRGLPPISEEEMQRRFQLYRDIILTPEDRPEPSREEVLWQWQRTRELMIANPMIASIPTTPSGNAARGSPVTGDPRAPASTTPRGEFGNGHTTRVGGSSERERRGAIATSDLLTTQALEISASVEAAQVDDVLTGGSSGEREGDANNDSDESLLSEADTETWVAAGFSPPRRSASPSPEDHHHYHQNTTTNSQSESTYTLPGKCPCTEHLDQGWELFSSRPSHAKAEDDKDSPTTSNSHTERPKTYNGDKEKLARDTCEILVRYQLCEHVEAIHFEKLEYVDDMHISAKCGCHGFDLRLVASQKASSRQRCLSCRIKRTAESHPEGYVWFEKHVRQIHTPREILLWPFGAKFNDGVLRYR